jgi:hypothetical protein
MWPDATVAILAGGPSLRIQNINAVFGVHEKYRTGAFKVVTVNDSWRLLPSFMLGTSKPIKCGCMGTGMKVDDLCATCNGTGNISTCAAYFCDEKWWRQSIVANRRSQHGVYSFHDAIYKLWWFSGSYDFADHPQVNALRLTGQSGHEDAPDGLKHGSNSGYQAIELAIKLGAKRIILLGYDMKCDNGRSHWHNEPRQADFADVAARSMLPHFESLVSPLKALGVNVINATPGSAIECFPKATLEEALSSASPT